MSTAHLPSGDRFEFWREMLSQQAVPMIRRSDPEAYLVLLNHKGRQQLRQDRRVAVLDPGDLVVLHTSHPLQSTGDPDSPHQIGTVLMLEPGLLPIPAQRLRTLVARPLPGSDGVVALVAQFILGLSTGQFHPDDASRLAPVTASLVSLMLARQLDTVPALPTEDRLTALAAKVRAYILDRLGKDLTPESIAMAHHISVRTLHRLFQPQGVTVSAWIRERRLDRCRVDLRDVALAARSVRAIGARWGFRDAAHFTRAFKSRYGMSPAVYRNGPAVS